MKYKKTAIIFGITGQDGAYLSHLLLQKGYKVIGTTRKTSNKNVYRLKRLNVIKKIILLIIGFIMFFELKFILLLFIIFNGFRIIIFRFFIPSI